MTTSSPPSSGISSTFRLAFHGLDEPSLAILHQFATVKTYAENEILFRQGEPGYIFYVVKKGRVIISQQQDDGTERILGIYGPGQYFGEMALLDDSPRMATCTVLTATTVLEVTQAVFHQVAESSPAVAYHLTRQVLSNMRTNDKRALAELAAKNQALQQAYQELKEAQDRLVEKQRLVRELEIAAQVQRSLLPDLLPEFADYRFAAYLEPARTIGGDLYDVICLDDEHVGLLLADVADKSVQAAIFMAVIRTLFLVESRSSLSPAQVALRVHQDMMDVSTTDDVFVTVFYGVLHRSTGTLSYVIAGHERPLLIRPEAGVSPIPGQGRFLGILEDLHLDEFQINLQGGDRLLVFSDGVPDAINHKQERYGLERLHSLLTRKENAAAAFLVEAIKNDIASWTRGVPPFDDITLLCIEAK